MSAGATLEVTERVVRGECTNGVAIVRPPGHHAEAHCCKVGAVTTSHTAQCRAIATTTTTTNANTTTINTNTTTTTHHHHHHVKGFCFFNNVAVAAAVARKQWGAERVLIVDWDGA